MSGRAKVPQLVGWGIKLLRPPLRNPKAFEPGAGDGWMGLPSLLGNVVAGRGPMRTDTDTLGLPLSRSLTVSQFIKHLTHPLSSQPASQPASQPCKRPNTVPAIVLFSMLFLWDLSHRQFVLTESIPYCRAGFVIHSLPLPLPPLPGSIWLTSCKS